MSRFGLSKLPSGTQIKEQAQLEQYILETFSEATGRIETQMGKPDSEVNECLKYVFAKIIAPSLKLKGSGSIALLYQ